MDNRPGTYALLLRSDSHADIRIGRLGQLALQPGFYIYVGSAFGPGGVQARVERHFRRTRRLHWHVDYLRAHTTPLGAWYSHDRKRLEHLWAGTIGSMPDISVIEGFGCSDCHCRSHLFHARTLPDIEASLSVDAWQQCNKKGR